MGSAQMWEMEGKGVEDSRRGGGDGGGRVRSQETRRLARWSIRRDGEYQPVKNPATLPQSPENSR